MTTETATRNEPVVPEAGSRLKQLVATYARLKPELEELTERFEAAKASIKAELAEARPGETSVTLIDPLLDRPLRMTHKTSWRIDSKKLKKELPETYVRYAYQSSTWELRAS